MCGRTAFPVTGTAGRNCWDARPSVRFSRPPSPGPVPRCCCAVTPESARPACSNGPSAGPGPRTRGCCAWSARLPSRVWPTPRSTRCCGRCWTSPRAFPPLSRTRWSARSACVRERLRTDSPWATPHSACSPGRPPAGRCSWSSTTCSGPTRRVPRSSPSCSGGSNGRRWSCSLPRAMRRHGSTDPPARSSTWGVSAPARRASWSTHAAPAWSPGCVTASCTRPGATRSR